MKKLRKQEELSGQLIKVLHRHALKSPMYTQ